MDLTTQCPQCGTVFKATLEQLQLRKGYIRCVHCAHIFDGYEAVVPAQTPSQTTAPTIDLPEPVATSPYVAARPATSLSAPAVVRGRREFSISGRGAPSSGTEPALHTVPGASAAQAPSSSQREPSLSDGLSLPAGSHRSREPSFSSRPPGGSPDTVYAPVRRRSSASASRTEPMLSETDGAAPAYDDSGLNSATASAHADDAPYVDRLAWGVRAVWGLLILLGACVLVLQLAYVFRLQIAESLPGLRPGLERMCASLHCTVPYSRRPDQLLLTHSALQQDAAAPDATDDGETHFVLQATLRNAYDKPQEWPTLVLELTDAAGARIGRKQLPPATWLLPDMADKPFPASSEHTLSLPLTFRGLRVNGYQLTTFFP